tara:strand:+ start:44 stop:475 length:432 start_codon:yes stop_codon:yes gene_type:complete
MIFNKYFILETLNVMFVNIIYVYSDNPTKAEKTKLKEFLRSLPHLMFDDSTQNKLFQLLIDHPVESYNDNHENLRDYLYYIYREVTHFLNLQPKTHSEFYDGILKEIVNDNKVIREMKRKYINTVLYLVLFITIIYLYMKYIN